MKSTTILLICMGNICRSPTAEAVLGVKLAAAGLADRVRVDSAGTHAFHIGSPPDDRSQAHARRRGYDLSALRARQVSEEDFERCDLLLAMDWDNLALLQSRCPAAEQRKLRLLMEFAPAFASRVVPDPYDGGAADFEAVLDHIEAACDGLVEHLSKTTKP